MRPALYSRVTGSTSCNPSPAADLTVLIGLPFRRALPDARILK
jgi:hypothetical protein